MGDGVAERTKASVATRTVARRRFESQSPAAHLSEPDIFSLSREKGRLPRLGMAETYRCPIEILPKKQTHVSKNLLFQPLPLPHYKTLRTW